MESIMGTHSFNNIMRSCLLSLGILTESSRQPKRTTIQHHDGYANPIHIHLREEFLSPAEAKFYHLLREMAGARLLVCPKVSLDDIFSLEDLHEPLGVSAKLNRQNIDFILCRPDTLHPILGIELEESEQQTADQLVRDRFVDRTFAAAGLPLARLPAQENYSPLELIQLFRQVMGFNGERIDGLPSEVNSGGSPAYAPYEGEDQAGEEASYASSTEPLTDTRETPVCPHCAETMEVRIARRGKWTGQEFFACVNFPGCREVILIE